jgi:hypothetical protein
MEKLTIVTVTVTNGDGECECYCERFDPTDSFTLDELVDGCIENAVDKFNEQGFAGLEHRVLVNVNTMPKPTIRPGTRITAELPEQSNDDPTIVNTEIS